MNQAFFDALKLDFPDQFEHIRGAPECGDGWEPIIRRTCEKFVDKGVFWDCIKEKYGGLRMYGSVRTFAVLDQRPAIDWQPVEEAEMESIVTCETCGAPAETREVNGWLYTRCDEHLPKTKTSH